MTSFEQAVAAGGPLIAAWDYEDNDRQRLVLFEVGAAGWKQRGETQVSAAEVETTQDQLAERGVRIGGTYAGGGHVWVADERGWAVWTETAQTGSGEAPAPGVARVHVVYEGGAPDRRAVVIEQQDGGTLVVAEERSMWPSLDITYDQVNLEMDTLWAHYLSLHLALWHVVPLVNDISPFSVDVDLSIVRAARALAQKLSALPDIGTFESTLEALPALGRANRVALALVPVESEPAARAVELRVIPPDGKLTSVPLKRGARSLIAAFLHRVTTPAVVQSAVGAVLEAQKRGGRA